MYTAQILAFLTCLTKSGRVKVALGWLDLREKQTQHLCQARTNSIVITRFWSFNLQEMLAYCWCLFFHKGSLKTLPPAKLFGRKRKFHGKATGCHSKSSPVIRWNFPSMNHLVESVNDIALGKKRKAHKSWSTWRKLLIEAKTCMAWD